MKIQILLSTAALSLNLAAYATDTLPKGVVFQRDGTYSEYPSAYKINKPIKLILSAKSGPFEARTIPCQLPAGKKIILVKATAVVTQTSQTGKLQAQVDMDLSFEDWNNEKGTTTVQLKKGEVVEDLSYYAEGACLFKVQGKEYEGSCLGNGGSYDEKMLKPISTLEVESSVKITSCINKTTGWISESDIEEYPQVEGFLYNPY